MAKPFLATAHGSASIKIAPIVEDLTAIRDSYCTNFPEYP